jgi:hypothetical protein
MVCRRYQIKHFLAKEREDLLESCAKARVLRVGNTQKGRQKGGGRGRSWNAHWIGRIAIKKAIRRISIAPVIRLMTLDIYVYIYKSMKLGKTSKDRLRLSPP